MKKTCKTCVFFQQRGNRRAGVCRRYPPVLLGWFEYSKYYPDMGRQTEDGSGPEFGFPRVDKRTWCGEYQEKK